MNKVFVVGRNYVDRGIDILGIFDDEKKAINACTHPNDFVGPTPFNEYLGDDSIEWPGLYYPLGTADGA